MSLMTKETFENHKKKIIAGGIAGIIMLITTLLGGFTASFTVSSDNNPTTQYTVEVHGDK